MVDFGWLFDIWPGYQAVDAILKASYVAETNILVDLKDIHKVVDKYKKQNSIEGKIEAILATDAVSLTPEIYVTKDGFVEGLLQKEQLKSVEMKILEHKFKNFEELCKKRKDVTITDAFLFHVQPINALLRSFVCHISPSTQGKATNSEIDLLMIFQNYYLKTALTLLALLSTVITCILKCTKSIFIRMTN